MVFLPAVWTYIEEEFKLSELRKDPISERWIVTSLRTGEKVEDLLKPGEWSEMGVCPFCPGNENKTAPEIFSFRGPDTAPDTRGWEVRVIPHKYNVLRKEGDLTRTGVGMYDLMSGIGAHEIVIETPKHVNNLVDQETEQIKKVFIAYQKRIIDLKNDERLKYVLIFKNQGKSPAVLVEHSHSQIIATPCIPKRVKEELRSARQYYEYKARCIFCDMIKQEINLQERLITENSQFLAFIPFAPRFPFEVWILPKRHNADFSRIEERECLELAKIFKIIMTKLNKLLNGSPLNYVVHTIPFTRPRAGYWLTIQDDFHWHLEIMPQVGIIAGFEWGSSFYINPPAPEICAKLLRDVIIE